MRRIVVIKVALAFLLNCAYAKPLYSASTSGANDDLSLNWRGILVPSQAISMASSLGAANVYAAGSSATASDTVPQTRTQRMDETAARTFDIGELGGRGDATSDTAALLEALAGAKANPGSVIRFGAGVWPLKGTVYYYTIPNDTVLTGAGRYATVLTWNDSDASNRNPIGLFGLDTSAGRAHDVMLKDFTVNGSFAAAGEATGGGYPIQADMGDHIRIKNVGSVYSRAMGIVAQDDTDLSISDSYVAFTDRDGINTSQSSDISIVNNVIEHTDDDCIATHSGTGEVRHVRQIVVITGNRCFDTSGIHAVGLRVGTIVGNVIAQPKLHGIAIDTSRATTVGSRYAAEGFDSEVAISITGNTITNVIDRYFVDKVNGGANYIVITGSSARAGTYSSVPGTAAANGVIPNPYYETFANSSSTNTPTPPSNGILVSGNVMQAYQPPTDGSDSRFGQYSDLGFGRVWTRNGFLDPKLPAVGTRDGVCVSVFGGELRGIHVDHNICSGVATALNVGDATNVGDIDYSFNTDYDISDQAILLNAGAAKGTVLLDSNRFDLDPFFLAKARSSAHDGTWTSPGPFGILQKSSSSPLNIIARGNLLLNAYADANVDTSRPPPNWFLADNLVFADWQLLGAYSALNKGVGVVRVTGGFRAVQMDSDPRSLTFGEILTPSQEHVTALPSSGKYAQGSLLWNSSVRRGDAYAGWIKSSNSMSNVLGSDWYGIPALVGGNLYVPGSIAATGIRSTGDIKLANGDALWLLNTAFNGGAPCRLGMGSTGVIQCDDEQVESWLLGRTAVKSLTVAGQTTTSGLKNTGASSSPIAARVSAFSFGPGMDAVEVSNANKIPYNAVLPTCSLINAGVGYQIVKTDRDSSQVILKAADENTISGVRSLTLAAQWTAIQVKCDGKGTWIKGLH